MSINDDRVMQFQQTLKGKSPAAREAYEVALDIVDLMLSTWLDEIQLRADAIGTTTGESFDECVGQLGPLLRLNIQKQLLTEIRAAVPRVALKGDVTALRGVVG